MTNPRLRTRPALLAVAASVVLVSLPALAISKRDQAAVDALTARMQAAEARYAQAMVDMRNASPGAQREGDAALEDMEDVMAGCMRQRGCPVNTMLSSYKRLLKHSLDAESGGGTDEAATGLLAADDLGPDVPEGAAAARLLAERARFDRIVEQNPAVQQAIRRWLTDMRGSLMNSYENYQYMRHLMWPHYEKAGLPEAMLFGIMAKESNGKVHVGSRAGAVGPMQFMPATGKRFGLGDDGTGFDTRYDPHASGRASAAYLTERMRELNGNIEMALAAYNGGEGRALRVYRETGGRSYWDPSVYRQFPAETQDYVPMVVAAAWLFLHPEEYGISFPDVSTRQAAVRLEKPASIYELTICLGNSGSRDGYMRTLRNLNPRYQADEMLPAGTVLTSTRRIAGLYNRWCADGARADLARGLVLTDPVYAARARGQIPVAARAPATAPVSRVTIPAVKREYRVQRGETLTSIARKFECSVGDLARANALDTRRHMVREGQVLKLEGCSAT